MLYDYVFMNKIFFIILFQISLLFSEIRHLEIGAANYDASITSKSRFEVLYYTVSKLIEKFGNKGIIYLNDIDLSGLELAKKELDLWLFQNGFEDIQVETINDDFSNISIPQINSAQMAYPESSMLSLMRYSTTFAKLIDKANFGLKIIIFSQEPLVYEAKEFKIALPFSEVIWSEKPFPRQYSSRSGQISNKLSYELLIRKREPSSCFDLFKQTI